MQIACSDIVRLPAHRLTWCLFLRRLLFVAVVVLIHFPRFLHFPRILFHVGVAIFDCRLLVALGQRAWRFQQVGSIQITRKSDSFHVQAPLRFLQRILFELGSPLHHDYRY